MRLIDATRLVKLALIERDKIPLTVPLRYAFGATAPNRHGQSMRGGIRKILRLIEQAPTIDAAPVVRCKSCMKRSTFECPMYSEVDGSDYGLDIIINDRTDDDGFCNEGALMDVEEKSKANGGAKNGADV